MQGAANPRYPNLREFDGTFDEFSKRVREGSTKGMPAYSADLVSDSDVSAIYAYFTGGAADDGPVPLGDVVPLFEAADAASPPIVFERDDGVLVTRGAGRVRGRHEGPLDTNEPFMEFVTDYFASQDLATEPTAFDGRSDYGPFIAVGIPAGGLFSGAEEIKANDEEDIYGGVAGLAYDPCYHQPCDSLKEADQPQEVRAIEDARPRSSTAFTSNVQLPAAAAASAAAVVGAGAEGKPTG